MEKLLTALMNSPPAEMMTTITSLKNTCACPVCPSYTGCAKNSQENLFCTFGASFPSISQDRGAIYQGCPAVKQAGLTKDRYCMKGAEAGQRYFSNVKQFISFSHIMPDL